MIAWRLYNAEGDQLDYNMHQMVQISDPNHWTYKLIGMQQGFSSRVKAVVNGVKAQYKVQIKEVLPF